MGPRVIVDVQLYSMYCEDRSVVGHKSSAEVCQGRSSRSKTYLMNTEHIHRNQTLAGRTVGDFHQR